MMNIPRRPQTFLLVLSFICINAVILSFKYQSVTAYAQVACSNPPLAAYGIRETWPKFAQLDVNIHTFWQVEKKAAIEKAFDSWEHAGEGSPNCSGVVYHPATNNPVSDDIRNLVVRPFNTVNVVETDSPGYQVSLVGPGGRHESQVIYLSSCKTDLKKLTSLTAHEIGHSFGLDNCTASTNPQCTQAGQSIMGPSSGNPSDPRGCDWSLGDLEGPTFCDNTTVALYYCDIAGDPPGGGGGGGSSCDPSGQQEWYCYSGGGIWDSYNCTCDYSGSGYCDPDGSQQWVCESGGGTWNPDNCDCGSTSGCALGVAELVSENYFYYTWFGWPDNMDCYDITRTYKECTTSCSDCNTYEQYATYCCAPTNWGWCL